MDKGEEGIGKCIEQIVCVMDSTGVKFRKRIITAPLIRAATLLRCRIRKRSM